MNRAFSRWIVVLAAVAGFALTTSAQTLSPLLDAICGFPGVRISNNDDTNTVAIVEGTYDLDSPAWTDLVTVNGGVHSHDWFDPEYRAAARRFYRMRFVPRPPLAFAYDFRLTDHLGYSHELFREGDARIVVLAFVDNASLPDAWSQLKPVIQEYGANGVRFWMINAVDSRADLASAAAAAGVTQPILHDAAQLVTKSFGGTTAGEVVAIDTTQMVDIYRGAIAADCASAGGTVHQNYLADALAQSALGAEPDVQQSLPLGRSLALSYPTNVSYSKDIAPLLLSKCITCHSPGNIGSWTMTNYQAVADHTGPMRDYILEGLMPPWHADHAYLAFTNDYSITPAQQATLVAWIDAGAPIDGNVDPLAATKLVPPPDWKLGPPDMIFSMTNQVPSKFSEAVIPYQYVFLQNTNDHDVWVRAAVIKPGDRRVVHHSLLFVGDTATLLQILSTGGLSGFFSAYVPGLDPVFFPEGTGKLLKAGDYLVFQMHYTPIADAVTDNTSVGFYFMTNAPAHELKTASAYTTSFKIPANDKSYPTLAQQTFTKAVTLYEMSPHMHLRGNSMRFTAYYPNGTSEILLNVPKYDFAWQTLYRLTAPKHLPAGTTVKVTGDFDNSQWNPANPDPSSSVTFGEQTFNEMFIGYVNYIETQ